MLKILPHEISCALCVHVFCQKLKDNDGWGEVMSKEIQHQILLNILKAIRNPNLSFKGFLEFVQEALPSDLFQMFAKEISSLEDADQLMNLFKSIEEFTLERQLTSKLHSASLNQVNFIKRTSVLGLFLRKLIINFEKMSFDNVNKLYKAFNSYMLYDLPSTPKNQSSSSNEMSIDLSCADESAASMSSMMLEDSNEGEHDSTKEDNTEENKENIATPKFPQNSQNDIFLNKNNVLNFIAEQADLLESNSWHALEPHTLQQKIQEIQRLHADIIDVYYLSFLNYLRVSEVNKAKKMLCLYFDYKVFQSKSTKNDLTEMEKHQAMFKRFRYCALNLGIMHCNHGNYNESLLALEEAVRVSQETNDDQCLKHAIFWLNIVKEETGQLQDSSVESLYEEITRNMNTEDDQVIDNLEDIDCLGVLRYSRILAFKGIYKPKTLLSTISKIVVSNIDFSSTALLTRSSLLDFYGFKLLSIYNCQIPLQTVFPTEKITTKQSRLGITDENFVLSLCHLAMHLGYFCYFEKSKDIIEFIRNQVPIYSPFLKLIKKTSSLLNFQQNIMERNLTTASRIADFVTVIDYHEGIYMSAVVDVVYSNFSEAERKALLVKEEMSAENSSLNTSLKAKVLLMLIEIKLCSINPMQAVDDILRLLSFVESIKMCGMKIEANICLIRYYFIFGLFEKALEFIDDVFIDTQANGNPYCCGLLYFYQGKCLHAMKKNLEKNNMDNTITSGDILPLYEKALQYFEQSNSKARISDAYYEQALLFHGMGRTQERNEMAKQYRILHEELQQFSECVLY